MKQNDDNRHNIAGPACSEMQDSIDNVDECLWFELLLNI